MSQFELFDLEPDLLTTFLHDRKLWVDFYQHIEPKYFQKDEISFIYKFYSVYFEKYRELPDQNQTLSVLRKKNKEQSYIDTAEAVYSAEPFPKHKVDSLREEVKHFIKKEKLFNVLQDNVDLLDKDREEVSQEEFMSFSDKVKEVSLWQDEVELGTKLHEVEDRYQKIEEEYSHRVLSPWPSYNDALGGGFLAKQLAIFIANSSAGKSIALDNCALQAWRDGHNVIIYTMELSELVKSQRIDAALTNIKMKALTIKKDEVAAAYRNIDSDGILYIKEFPMLSASATDLEQHLYQLELYEGIKDVGMIVTDYIDIMQPKGKNTGNAYTDQGTTCGNLRALAQMYDCPGLTATQFNRQGISVESIDEIHEGLMGDSIIKLRHADVLTAIWGSPEELLNNDVHFKNLKNRGGEKDLVLPMKVDFPHLKFYEP